MAGLLIPYYEPQLAPSNSVFQPNPFLVTPAQNASWKRGDILAQVTTGSITPVPGNGANALAGVAGPAASAITITNHASTGAPALAYYIVATYTDGGTGESKASAEILYNAPAGYVPEVTVASAGAPSGATDFNVYAGLAPGGAVQQTTGTALGSASDLAYPLTNSRGANAITSNPSANLLGIAQSSSDSTFGAFPGGTYIPKTSAFGATADFPPIAPGELGQLYCISLNGQPLEISLSQAYALEKSLEGTSVGLTVDATSGWVYADPAASNKVARIQGVQSNIPALIISNATATSGNALGPGPTGQYGDLGGRVIITFTSGLIA